MVPFNFYQIIIIGIVFLLLIQCTNINNSNYEYTKQQIAFNKWVNDYKKNAQSKLSISPELLDQIFQNVKYNKDIIALDNRQVEFTLTADKYFQIVLPSQTFTLGEEFLTKHWKELNIISEKYKIPPHLIIAFLGIETRYGTKTPRYKAVEAIANLAFNPRRTTFFTNELNSLLVLINKGYVPYNVKSSWAGALGYPQFMPSTYLYYGIDGSGDDIVDLINNYEDIFASVSNFLRFLGWNQFRDWGYEVTLPQDFDYELITKNTKYPLYKWDTMGVKRINNKVINNISALSRIILLDNNKAYLVTSNFEVIMKWNKSTLFAVAVGILSDYFQEYSKSIQPINKTHRVKVSNKTSSKKNKVAKYNKTLPQIEEDNTLQPTKENLQMNTFNSTNTQEWLFEEKRRLYSGEGIN